MGIVYTIKCKDCGFEHHAQIGVGRRKMGFLDENPSTKKAYFYGYLNGRQVMHILDDIKRLLDKYGTRVKAQSVQGGLYLCPDCGQLYNEPDFKLVYPDGNYSPIYKCVCGSVLKSVDPDDSYFDAIDRKDDTPDDPGIVFHTKEGKIINWNCPNCQGNTIELCDLGEFD
jgi:hypothetical protein